MAISYSVSCPSCDAPVTLRAKSAPGKKIECPKCKYRFVPPPPDDADEPADDAAAAAKKKKGPGATVLVGAALGVLAVGLLGAGGYFLFADNDDTTKPVAKGTPVRPPQPPPTTKPVEKDPKDKPPVGPKVEPKVKTPTGPPKDLTNMLPNDTVAVYRVNFEKLSLETPFYAAFFDAAVRENFKASLQFTPDDVSTYVHCLVGKDAREPFAVIRLKAPLDLVSYWDSVPRAAPDRGTVKSRPYFLLPNNPFLTSVSRGLNGDSLRGVLGVPPDRTAPPKPADPRPLAMHLYDAQTLLIAPEPVLVEYLENLQDKTDLPKYLTELTTTTEPKPVDPKTPPKGPPTVPPKGGPTPPVTPPVPPPVATDPPVRKLYTSIPTYRTIDPTLKRLLNQLEEDERVVPAVVTAELADQREIAKLNLPKTAQTLPAGVVGFLDQITAVGASLRAFATERFDGTVVVEFAREDDAKAVLKEKLTPGLELLAGTLGTLFETHVTVKSGGQVTTPPTGGPPTGFPPKGPPTGFPPKGPPTGFPPKGPPPRPVPPGDGDDMPPVRPGGPVTGPGGPGTPPVVDPKLRPSHIDIAIVDKIVTVSAVVQWNDELYRTAINPAVGRLAAQLKGKMSVFSGDLDWYSLARAPRGIRNVPPVRFPAGTTDRDLTAARLRQPFPPETRVSFFADLLPFLGRPGLRSQIDPKKDPWFAGDNLTAGEAWVPEFLVPYYPQDSWRATHPLADGKSLGGTNYAGLAGVGFDAARYDPKNPDHAKKMGMTGYDWGSRAEDVKDGLSNTAYLAQLPPGAGRGWIVGGGATLVGVDESDPQAALLSPTPDGKRGTYLLMGDGSVRFVAEKATPEVFRALVTRAANDAPKDLDAVAPVVPERNRPENEVVADPPKKADPAPAPEPAPKPQPK